MCLFVLDNIGYALIVKCTYYISMFWHSNVFFFLFYVEIFYTIYKDFFQIFIVQMQQKK